MRFLFVRPGLCPPGLYPSPDIRLPSDSIFTYLFSGKWERGLNLFSVTCSLMAAGGAGVVVMILDRLLSILGNAMDPRGETICRLLKSIVRYAAILIMIFYTLSLFGVNPGAILASAGLVTVIIGIGSQSLISDILSGLFIIFEGDFQVGDIVDIAGYRGTVQEIGVRSTKIIGRGDNIKIIDNRDIKNVINMTRLNSWYPMELKVSMSASLSKIEKVLSEELPNIGQKYSEIISGPVYKGVVSLGNGTMTLSLITECKEQDYYEIERILNREMRLLFEKEEIQLL